MPIRHELRSNIPSSFWPWFAGFMDGDGAIVFDSRPRSDGSKQAKITILQKERKVLDHIVETLGTGSICQDKRGYHHFMLGTYATRECLKKMVGLFISDSKRSRAETALEWEAVRQYTHFGRTEDNPKHGPAMKLYKSGMSSEAVAKALGLPGITVRRWAKKAKIWRSRQ